AVWRGRPRAGGDGSPLLDSDGRAGAAAGRGDHRDAARIGGRAGGETVHRGRRDVRHRTVTYDRESHRPDRVVGRRLDRERAGGEAVRRQPDGDHFHDVVDDAIAVIIDAVEDLDRPVVVGVVLVRIRDCGTVVAPVAPAVAVPVRLRRVGEEGAVVVDVQDRVEIGIAV